MSLSSRLDRLERPTAPDPRGWTEVWYRDADDPAHFTRPGHPEQGRLTEAEARRRSGRPLLVVYDLDTRPDAFTLDVARMNTDAEESTQ